MRTYNFNDWNKCWIYIFISNIKNKNIHWALHLTSYCILQVFCLCKLSSLYSTVFLHIDFSAQQRRPCKGHFITHSIHWESSVNEVAWIAHKQTLFYLMSSFGCITFCILVGENFFLCAKFFWLMQKKRDSLYNHCIFYAIVVWNMHVWSFFIVLFGVRTIFLKPEK